MLHYHRLRDARGAGDDAPRGGGVSSIGSGKSVYYMVKVLLAIFIGLAGAARPRAGRCRARRRGAEDLMDTVFNSSRSSLRAACCCVVLELVAGAAFSSATRCSGCSRASVMLALAIWRGAADGSRATSSGSSMPPNALFFVAFGFVLVLLLHFSLAVSRLTDQSKVLAQRLALLEERARRAPSEDPAHADSDAMSSSARSAIERPRRRGRALTPTAPRTCEGRCAHCSTSCVKTTRW